MLGSMSRSCIHHASRRRQHELIGSPVCLDKISSRIPARHNSKAACFLSGSNCFSRASSSTFTPSGWDSFSTPTFFATCKAGPTNRSVSPTSFSLLLRSAPPSFPRPPERNGSQLMTELLHHILEVPSSPRLETSIPEGQRSQAPKIGAQRQQSDCRCLQESLRYQFESRVSTKRAAAVAHGTFCEPADSRALGPIHVRSTG